MKSRRGEKTLILFHNGKYFETYGDDANVVAEMLNLTPDVIDDTLTLRIAEVDINASRNKLLDAGHAVFISEMRDSEGNYITNIAQIEDE